MVINYLEKTRELLDRADAQLDEGHPEEGLVMLTEAHTLLRGINGFRRVSKEWRDAKEEYEQRYTELEYRYAIEYETYLDVYLRFIPPSPNMQL